MIDRPIDEVFAFLADGENDPKFSSRVLEIAKTTDGPPGVGTVYASTVKDGGVKFKREFRLTAFDPPTRIRWAEIVHRSRRHSRGRLRPRPGGRGDAADLLQRARAGQLLGKLIVGFALRSARKGADDFAQSIKRVVESETAAAG